MDDKVISVKKNESANLNVLNKNNTPRVDYAVIVCRLHYNSHIGDYCSVRLST